MKIRIKVQAESSAYPIHDIVLDSSLSALVPQADDQITNGQTVRVVKARVFEYKEDEIIVTLVCAYS